MLNIEVRDLYLLLKAVETAHTKGAFNELETQAFKDSFDKVHAVIKEINTQNQLEQQQTVQQATTTTNVVSSDTTDTTEE